MTVCLDIGRGGVSSLCHNRKISWYISFIPASIVCALFIRLSIALTLMVGDSVGINARAPAGNVVVDTTVGL